MQSSHGTWLLYYIILPAIGLFALSLVFRILQSIYNRRLGKAGNLTQDVKRYSIMLIICFGLALLSVVLFKLLPSTLSKAAPTGSQKQACAIEAGYVSPEDNNSAWASSESKSIYQRCLEAK